MGTKIVTYELEGKTYEATVEFPDESTLDNSTPFKKFANSVVGGVSQMVPFGDEMGGIVGGRIDAALNNERPTEEHYNRRKQQVLDAQKMYNEASFDGGIAESIAGSMWLPMAQAKKGASLGEKFLNLERHAAGYGGLFGFDKAEGEFSDRIAPAIESAGSSMLAAPAMLAVPKAAQLGFYLGEKTSNGIASRRATLADPQYQKALKLAEKLGPGENGLLNRPAAKTNAFNMGKGTREAVDLVNQKAQGEALPRNIAAQLGSAAGDTSEEVALHAQMGESTPQLMKSDIFQKSNSVSELIANAKDRVRQLNNERTIATTDLDEATRNLNIDWLDKGGRVPASAWVKGQVGTISPQTPEIGVAVRQLNERIEKLSKTELAQPIAKGLKSTMDSILRGLSPKEQGKVVTAKDVVDQIQNLNEVRRVLLEEFKTNNIAARERGNGPGVAEFEGSLEAIKTLQNSLRESLSGVIKTVNGKMKGKPNWKEIDPDIFTTIDDEYGALKDLTDLSDKFQRGTDKGRSVKDPTRIQQNSGPNAVTPSLFTPKGATASVLSWGKRKLFDSPNDALRTSQNVENRETQALDNIRDLMDLNKNPAKRVEATNKASSLFNKLGKGAQSLSVFAPLAAGVTAGNDNLPNPPPAHASAQPTLFRSRMSTKTPTTAEPSTSRYKLGEDDRRLKDLGFPRYESGASKKDSKISPELLDAVREVESSGGKNTTGPVTKYGRAQGPYQLIERFAKPYHEKLFPKEDYDPHDETMSRKIAAAMLADNLKWTNGNLVDAVTAYHSGIGNVKKKKLGPEGQAYAKRVFTVLKKQRG